MTFDEVDAVPLLWAELWDLGLDRETDVMFMTIDRRTFVTTLLETEDDDGTS